MAGRNDECPCGSGKKFKKCCLRRGENSANEWQRPDRQQVFEQMRRYTPKFKCLAPMDCVGTTCTEEPIDSHSVARGRELAGIAENNHVMGINADASAFFKGGVQQFRTIGIGVWDDSQKQKFLLGYRTLCKEIHARRLGNEAIIATARQHAHPLGQQMIDVFSGGSKNAQRNLARAKGISDAALLDKTYRCNATAFSLGVDFPIRAAGAFHPESDFAGKRRFRLSSESADYPFLCATTHSTDSDVLVIFTWFEDSPLISQFVNSFECLPPSLRRSAFAQLCFEHFENMFARPSWWNSLPKEKQESMETRFNASLSPEFEHIPGCLLPENTFTGV